MQTNGDYIVLTQMIPLQYWKKAFEILRNDDLICYELGSFDYRKPFPADEKFEPDFSGRNNAGPTSSTPGMLSFLLEAAGDSRNNVYGLMSCIRFDDNGNPVCILSAEMRIDGVVVDRHD